MISHYWEVINTYSTTTASNSWKVRVMSDQPKEKLPVPDGKSRFLTTSQNEPNEKGFVGYTTTWEPFQKEVEYTTPKKP
jgi:hypothetical protein